MTDSLESARSKLRRAHEHLIALDKGIERFLDSDPYTARRVLKKKGLVHRYKLQSLRQPPPDLALIIGDAAQNLRSVLDHAAYAAAKRHTPGIINDDKMARRVQFPICDTPDEFEDQAGRIAALSPTAQAVIKDLQPFGPERTDPDGRLPGLRDLSNTDKHRSVAIMAVSARRLSANWAFPPGLRIHQVTWVYGPLENGTQIAEFTFFEPHPEVDVEANFRFRVAIEQGNPIYAEPIDDVLQATAWHIESVVLPALTPFG